MSKSPTFSFDEISSPTLLRQEASVAKIILDQTSYDDKRKVILRYLSLISKPFKNMLLELALDRISSILRRFNKINVLKQVTYGMPDTENTLITLNVNKVRLKEYHSQLTKEIDKRKLEEERQSNNNIFKSVIVADLISKYRETKAVKGDIDFFFR